MRGICSVPKCELDINSLGHVFPKNQVLRDKWLKSIKRKDWQPGKWHKICCKHFKQKDYLEYSENGVSLLRNTLKKNVVPSIFPWNYRNKHSAKLNRDRKNKNTVDEPSVDEMLPVSSSQMNYPIKLTQAIEAMEDIEASQTGNSASLDYKPDIFFDGAEIEIKQNESINNIDDKNNKCEPENVSPVVNEQIFKTNHVFNFSLDTLKRDKKMLHFYTGLESYDKFMFIFQTLGPAVNHLNYFYKSKPSISVLDQFLLTIVTLRQNKNYYETSILFGIPLKQVGNIFITWIRFMKLQWSEVSQWASKELVRLFTPFDFGKKFPGTRGIIDATEIGIQRAGIPTSQQCTYSHYKNKTTAKTLICASPGGLVTHVSSIYGGSTSDRQILERCNLIEKCDPGDIIMADKGFDVQDLLAAYKVKLNIPTFFRKKNQLSGQTVIEDTKISSKRVHIERIIGLGKTFKILEGPLSGAHKTLADDIIFVCFMLVNFRRPIVSQYA